MVGLKDSQELGIHSQEAPPQGREEHLALERLDYIPLLAHQLGYTQGQEEPGLGEHHQDYNPQKSPVLVIG